MAQISYGTITITDTTDINKIENWYLATDLSSGVTRSNPASGHGTWTTNVQSMTSSFQYLWNYEKIYGTGLNNTDVLISQTDPVIIGRYGQNGTNGTNGTNGADGNSIVSIDEYYQTTNSTTNPGSSGWQKNTLVTPTSTNKYLWNYQVINYSKTAAEGSYTDARIIGVYGDTGPQGPQGNPGTNGINTATVYLYQRATSAPSKPSGNLTYTFSSASITSGTLGNWKQSIGELTGTDPIWVIAAVAGSNGTTDVIASTEWSEQIKLAQNGTDGTDGTNGTNGTNGLNQATVFIYKRATSATAPSATTYTFSNGSFTVPSGWSKTIPASDGNPCYVTSAVAIGNGTTATLTWNTPSVLVEDGTDGISPTVTSTSTGVKIVDAAGNTTYINNGSNGQSYYTHIRYATDSSGSNMSSSPTGKTYIGVYSGTSSTAPTTANSYTWSKYVGDPGTPATQYYAFVKYATDANGSNMQNSPDSTHIYVGTYTGTSSAPAASAYQWSKYVGADGQSATQYYAFIKYATSSAGANMTDTPTASTTYVGTYAGTKSSPTASDYKWSVYVGNDGVSVTGVRELYYLTTGNAPSKPTSSTTIYSDDRTGAWTSTVPSYVRNGKYYISLETSLSNNTKVFGDVTLDQATTNANANALSALDRTTAKYGSSSTGANTAAKVASCSNFVLFNGAEVFIQFTNKNTIANPTLNVNSTGAKSIKDSDGNNLAEQFYWKDNSLVHFVYDGTNWRILDIVTTEKYNNLVSNIDGVSSTVGQHTEQISGLGTRVSTNESNITQNANNIALKVSETDFNGNNIISKINLNSTTATISANRVEIDGTAIFSAIKSQTDAAYDASGAAAAVQNQIPDDLSDLSDSTGIIPDVSKTFVSATTLYYASNSTTAPSKPTSHISTNSTSTRGQWNIALPTYNASYPYLYICTEYKTKDNTYSWTSVEQTSYSSAISTIKTNADAAIKSQVNLYYASNSTTPPNKPTAHVSTNNSSSRGVWNIALPIYSDTYPYLYTCKETLTNDGTYAWTSVEQSTYVAATAAIKNVADAAAPKSSAVAKTQQIYYRSNSSTKPTVYPTTWVTAETNKWNSGNVSETNFNGWRRKVTPISDGTGANVTKYLYLWTATQKQLVDGTFVTLTADDIALDDSTTVIDGGKIITGSVTANQLNAADINASNSLTIGALTTTTQNDILNSQLTDDIANAEANASYSVEIKVSAIDYTANTATLVATPYYQGSTTMPTGVTISYQWYKDSVSNNNPDNRVGTSSTLSVTATMGLDHSYICVIS